MKIVQKLTPKTLGWDRTSIAVAVSKTPADGSSPVLLGRIVGIVAGLRQTINNDTGEVQSGLKGNFRGKSSIAGHDEVTAGVCYLPAGIQAMIEGALASAQEKDAKATVQFAIDLFAHPDANKAGYTFNADNIVAADTVDPLAALLAQAETMKALPAPVAAAAEPAAAEPAATETATAEKDKK